MPIYIIECEKCHKLIERILSIDGGLPDCECGGRTVKKITSPAVIRVRNSGGYLVRSKGYKDGYSKEVLKDTSPETI